VHPPHHGIETSNSGKPAWVNPGVVDPKRQVDAGVVVEHFDRLGAIEEGICNYNRLST